MFDDTKDFADRIMEQPDAALIVQHVQEKLKSEQQKRQEFYETISEDDKAEFINGEIVYHSPVMKKHSDATRLLASLLGTYVSVHQSGYVGTEKIMVTFTRNDYKPDLCFFNSEKSQHFTKNQMHFPVPDLAVEVLSNSKRALERDRKTKYKDYEKHGVMEYWIVDPKKEVVEQYVLEKEEYRLVMKSGEGTIRSFAVKDFAIPVRAIFDETVNLNTLRDILK